MPTARERYADEAFERSLGHFERLVQSVGAKRFAAAMSITTRQVNRMLSGTQPNPVDRIVRTLQSCEAAVGDEVIEYICQEVGGSFVRDEATIDASAVNAVRECAEAIAAISDGHITTVEESEIRQAIAALTALVRMAQAARVDGEPIRIMPVVRAEPLQRARTRVE